MVSFYRTLIGNSFTGRWSWARFFYDWLERPFRKDEIREVTFSMNDDKAPRLDGFPFSFYKVCWGVVRSDIVDVLTYFFQCGRFLRCFSAIFIMLIPKKLRARDIKDFHPISLVSEVYKIIAKILANRLKEVLRKVVSKF